tara:strand:- start:421 stop:633 length:213 start_codon:yes stop_codon:yes gene_type:complete
MGTKGRKYFYTDGKNVTSYGKKSFLVFWRENEKQKLSTSAGPYTHFKEAEEIMIRHLINGVCSWIVSYNG